MAKNFGGGGGATGAAQGSSYRMLYCGEVRIANSDTAAAASVSAATSVSLLVVLTLEVIMAVSSYADDWEFSSNDNSLLYLPLAHYSPGK